MPGAAARPLSARHALPGDLRRATLDAVILPFPIRVPVLKALLFTCVLVLVELLEGTDPRYSALIFCFFMLSVFAFNVAGGLSRPSGAYIFFFSVLVVDVGTVYKALLGEPAQSNLQEPLLLMSTYVASIAGMFLAAFLARRIATTKTGVAGLLNVTSYSYYEAALGSLALYFVITFAPSLIPGSGGQLLHSLQVVNPFSPLVMLLGTVAAVKDSRGWRSTNTLTVCAMAYFLWMGMLTFSKQGMFTPAACWVIGVAWARFRLRFVHFVALGSFIVFAYMVLVPIAQIGRDAVVTGTTDERVDLLVGYLTDIPGLRHQQASWEAPPDLDYRMYYYNQPHGLMDRLSMLPNDSVLVQWSEQGHYFGYLALRFYFENWVPHVLDPHKLEGVQVGGNAYMHEMGGLSDLDTTTGISFSPTAEAFHIDGWRSLLLVAPAVWFMLFVTSDAVCGDIRLQPLGMLYVLVFAHVAPEGLLGGAIELTRIGNLAVTLGIYFCGHVAPILGMLLRGKPAFRSDRLMHTSVSGPFRPGELGTAP